MASLFHWLLCCLCISNILLIISNMVESLGALEVLAIIMTTMIMIMIMIFTDDDSVHVDYIDNGATVMVSMVMLMMVSMMMTMVKLQVEMPGYLIFLPAFFVSSHVFLSTTVLITVAITIERYQVYHNDVCSNYHYQGRIYS